jgi:hypothetical protein
MATDHDRDAHWRVADHRSEQHSDADAKGDPEHQLDGMPHLLARVTSTAMTAPIGANPACWW